MNRRHKRNRRRSVSSRLSSPPLLLLPLLVLVLVLLIVVVVVVIIAFRARVRPLFLPLVLALLFLFVLGPVEEDGSAVLCLSGVREGGREGGGRSVRGVWEDDLGKTN